MISKIVVIKKNGYIEELPRKSVYYKTSSLIAHTDFNSSIAQMHKARYE